MGRGWRLIMPGHGETASATAGQASARSSSGADTASGINTSAGHLGHASGDPYYRRRHSAAGDKSPTAPADGGQRSGGAPAGGRTGVSLGDTGASDGATQAGQAGNQP